MIRRVRLLCFPHAGGNARAYVRWRTGLPSFVEVHPVQPPARGERITEPPCDRLPELLEDLYRQLPVRDGEHLAMFGHSLGAVLAFECARLLRDRRGVQPVWLFASGHRAPHLPRREAAVHHLPRAEFLARMRRLSPAPAVLDDPGLRRLFLPMLRADFTVAERYEYTTGAPLDCPITALGGTEDPDVDRAELAAWQHHTSAGCDVRMFPGGHFFLDGDRAPVLAVLADRLAATVAPAAR